MDNAARGDHESNRLYIDYRGESYSLDKESLWQAMQYLSEREQGVLILDYWQEWTDIQIAAELGVSDRTVRNIRSRAFRKIRRWFSLIRGST